MLGPGRRFARLPCLQRRADVEPRFHWPVDTVTCERLSPVVTVSPFEAGDVAYPRLTMRGSLRPDHS